MRRVALVLVVLVLGVACDPVPAVPVPQVSAGSGGDGVTVEAVLSQTPGRGWRWSTEDTGVVLEQGLAYFSSSSLAEADAVRALGTNWPGTPSEDFDTVSDAEEDGWHYVGEAGEPAFENSWANVGTQDLAFRIREAGAVDFMGTIGDGSWGSAVFTLPEGYRPSASTYFSSVGDNITGSVVISPVLGVVNPDGTVTLSKTTAATVDRVFVQAQFFLTPASTP